MRRILTALAVSSIAISGAARPVDAASLRRHVVRLDVVEIVAGRQPTSHHFDVVVADDGAFATTHAGPYTIGARWIERQPGKPMLTLKIDRAGPTPLHMGGSFRGLVGVPGLRFGSGGKGMLTEVLVTAL